MNNNITRQCAVPFPLSSVNKNKTKKGTWKASQKQVHYSRYSVQQLSCVLPIYLAEVSVCMFPPFLSHFISLRIVLKRLRPVPQEEEIKIFFWNFQILALCCITKPYWFYTELTFCPQCTVSSATHHVPCADCHEQPDLQRCCCTGKLWSAVVLQTFKLGQTQVKRVMDGSNLHIL